MSHIIVEIIEYVPNSVVIKTIIKKSTGNINMMSFDSGEGLTEKTSPFDTYAQIIEGKAEIVIAGVSDLRICGIKYFIQHAAKLRGILLIKMNEQYF